MTVHPPRLKSLIGALVLSAAMPAAAAFAEPTRLPEHVTPEIVRMIERGAQYLVRTQNPDGSWNNQGGYGRYPTAMTALAGTGLLATGSTPTRGPYSKAISKATGFLMRTSQRNGLFATTAEQGRSLHGHGFTLLFLAEVYGMEGDVTRQKRIHDLLARGARLTERSQSRAGGWLYTPNQDGDEGSVTVTQIQGLRACQNSGIRVNVNTIRRAIRYIELSANPDGGIRYSISSGGSRPPLTAAAVATLYNAGEYDSPLALKCLRYCDRTITVHAEINRSWGHYFYTHLYLAQAKYQRGKKEWADYYRTISRRLKSSQAGDGSWMGDQVGTTYGTAIALIILQLPYKFVPAYQR